MEISAIPKILLTILNNKSKYISTTTEKSRFNTAFYIILHSSDPSIEAFGIPSVLLFRLFVTMVLEES